MIENPLAVERSSGESTGRASKNRADAPQDGASAAKPPVSHGAPFAREAKSLHLARRFLSADLRSLGVLRIVLGALLALDLAQRFGVAEALYSNDGVLSNHYSLFRPLAPYQFSLYVGASSPREVTVAFALTLVVYFLFAIGYRTRLFHALSFVCVTSLHSRNLMTELPSDIPLHLWLGWTLFLPLGARFSVDALKRSFAVRRDDTIEELNQRVFVPSAIASIAVLGIVLQMSAMHVFAAVRQSGPAWQDGTALYYALHQKLWVTGLGSWIVAHVSPADLRAASLGYRAIEFAIGLVVLVPIWWVRRVSMALLVLFHIASRALWNVGPYDWVMLGAVPILVSPRDWDQIEAWYQGRKRRLMVEFDPSSGLSVWICRLLRRGDALSKISFAAMAEPRDLLVARDVASGETFTRSRAIAATIGVLPLGAVPGLVLRTPGVAWLADRVYDFGSHRRGAISAWLGMKPLGDRREGPLAEFDDSVRRWATSAATASREVAAALLLVVCGVALARDMGDEKVPSGLEGVAYRIAAYPRLFQRWGLFAPEPPKRPGTLVAEAEIANGSRVDPILGSDTPKSAVGAAGSRPAPLMAVYFTNISQPSRATYVNELREYVRRFGSRRDPSERVVWFNVDWIEAPIAAPEPGEDTNSPLALAPVSRRITSGP
jgi:hypothetical protein